MTAKNGRPAPRRPSPPPTEDFGDGIIRLGDEPDDARYEVLFTQRLVLTPKLELNAYGKSDPSRDIGAGLSDVEAGLRLRYEFTRRFAPYLGLDWQRRLGNTASMARAQARLSIFEQCAMTAPRHARCCWRERPGRPSR